MTLELAKEKGVVVDEEGFKEKIKKHQEMSREGSKEKFKNNYPDTSSFLV